MRSPQDHAGVAHSSNLCTEALLNTLEDEVAVCKLGSVNVSAHLDEAANLDHEKLKETVTTAIRMLDNVIDLNFCPILEAENSNFQHQPIGLGVKGFHNALEKGIAHVSEEAVEFADCSMEAVSYFAIRASILPTKERAEPTRASRTRNFHQGRLRPSASSFRGSRGVKLAEVRGNGMHRKR